MISNKFASVSIVVLVMGALAACAGSEDGEELGKGESDLSKAARCDGLDEETCDANKACESMYSSGPMTDTGMENFIYAGCMTKSR